MKTTLIKKSMHSLEYSNGFYNFPTRLNWQSWQHEQYPTLFLVGRVDYEEKFNSIINKLIINPKGKQLINEIFSQSAHIVIIFKEIPFYSSQGMLHQADQHCVEIDVSENLNEMQALSVVIFELCNAANRELVDFNTLHHFDPTNPMETFALAKEKCEYKSLPRAQDIYNYGVSNCNYSIPLTIKLGLFFLSEKQLEKIFDYLPMLIAFKLGRFYLPMSEQAYLHFADKKPFIFWGNSHTDFYRYQARNNSSYHLQQAVTKPKEAANIEIVDQYNQDTSLITPSYTQPKMENKLIDQAQSEKINTPSQHKTVKLKNT